MPTARERLIRHALAYPGAWEDHPWGETVVKVGKKVFLFAGADESAPARVSLKLPESAEEALGFDGVEPTAYGLGRSSWVTVPLRRAPRGLLEDWIEESYRAVAPKAMISALEAVRAPERH